MSDTRSSTQASHSDSATLRIRHGALDDRGKPLSPDELRKIDAYWRASLYLCLGMLYLKDNPLLREPLEAGAHEAAAAGPLGLGRRPVLHLHPLQPADQQVRPERDLSSAAPGTGRRRSCPRHISRAPIPRSTRTRAKTWRGCSASSSSSPSPAASAATPPRKRPAASTRAASWATASRTPMGRSTTTRT